MAEVSGTGRNCWYPHIHSPMMKRALLILALFGSIGSSAAAQTPSVLARSEAVTPTSVADSAMVATVVVPDSLAEEASWQQRALEGAAAGAVTSVVLTEQGASCAPSDSHAVAALFGAAWGAVRGVLRWGDDPDPPLSDPETRGKPTGPFPFDGEECKGTGR